MPAVAPPPAPVPPPSPTVLWDHGPAVALRWLTARPAWHTPEAVDWIVPNGTQAVVASHHGRIAIFDGTSGALSHERTLDGLFGVVDLGGGHLFVLAWREDHLRATVLDAATLATVQEQQLPDDATNSGTTPSVTRIPNGALVMAIPGQPLALYDTTTFKRTRVLAKSREWTNVMATATSVYASRPNPTFGESNAVPDPRNPVLPTIDARINIKTGKADETARHPYAVGPDVTYQPRAVPGLGWYGGAVFEEASDTPLRIVDASDIGPDGTTSAFDESGAHIAVEDHGEVKEYSATTGKMLEHFPIARSNFFDERPFPFHAMAFADTSLYVAYEHEIRVVDLGKRTVTPAPLSPSESLSSLLVDNSGDVQTIDRVVSRFANGARTATYRLRGDAMALATSTLGLYGERISSNVTNTPDKIVISRDGKVVKEWSTPFVEGAWVTTAATPIVWDLADSNRKDTHVELKDGIQRVLTWNSHSSFDLDPAANLAITDGTLLDLKTGVLDKVHVDGPCKSSNRYRLERGGTRVLAWWGDELILRDRATKKQLASIQLPNTMRSEPGSAETPLEAQFLAGTDDVLIYGIPGFAIWSPTKNELRTVPYVNVRLATSPDGHTVALVLGDGRVGIAAYEPFRASLQAETPQAASTTGCPSDIF